jgi:hypothetical protein
MDPKFTGGQEKFQEKHQKYIDFYTSLNANPVKDNEYWGLGIENESYLMFETLTDVPRHSYMLFQKRERYSVDYWKNYKNKPLVSTLQGLPINIKTPTYINSHSFQFADIDGNHMTLYKDKNLQRLNPKFTGLSVDTFLKQKSPIVSDLFKNNMIYDGDTIEFTTFDFYKTNVESILKELSTVKATFLKEVNTHLYGNGVFKDRIIYPPFNYGFARHLSNPENIAMCNNGTYHINLTLPTTLDSNGNIADLDEFKKKHANAIRGIQWVEPLIIALYGSPDILHTLNAEYSGGSQRLCLSRYIGLGTYDTKRMEKGKLLDTHDYKKSSGYFAKLHLNSPYNPPEKTGYDFNYNKYIKHGIELRVLDSFPEEHLESLINFLVLICNYSIRHDIPDPIHSELWNTVVIDCLQKGSSADIKPDFYNLLYGIFGISSCWPFFNLLFKLESGKSPHKVLNRLSEDLYIYNRNGNVSKKLSPNMKPIQFVDYNAIMKNNFKDIIIDKSIR